MTFCSKTLSKVSLVSIQKVLPRILPNKLAFSESVVYFFSSNSRVEILPGPLDRNLFILCQKSLDVVGLFPTLARKFSHFLFLSSIMFLRF